MNKFVFLSFLFMGWAFYELSGGADFVPPSARLEAAAENPPASEPGTGTQAPRAPVFVHGSNTEPDPAETRLVLGNAPPAPEPVATPEPEPEPEPVATAGVAPAPVADVVLSLASLDSISDGTVPAPAKDIRIIDGTLVNIRSGPGTDYPVILQLQGGTEVEILEDPGAGWIRMQNPESREMGWISAGLLRQ
jgi:hypothetical protein